LDRLVRFEDQLVSWAGEVSAAIYVETGADVEQAKRSVLMTCANALRRRSALISGKGSDAVWWTVTLLYGLQAQDGSCKYDFMYPVNALRNVAVSQARSEMLFLLDVDFVPSSRLFAAIEAANIGGRLRESLLQRQGCLVVPAFEWACPAATNVSDVLSADAVPRCFVDLRCAVNAGHAEGFHCRHFPRGHGPTDFPRWFSGTADGEDAQKLCVGDLTEANDGLNAYRVEYSEHFEPYIIVPRELVPRYDERFRGYGMNKISHLYELAVSWGVDFFVACSTEAFVVAPEHKKSQSWHCTYGAEANPEQRTIISMHYTHFKEDLKRRGRRLPYWEKMEQTDVPELPASTSLQVADTLCQHLEKIGGMSSCAKEHLSSAHSSSQHAKIDQPIE